MGLIYRAMVEENSMPKLGKSAITLAIRRAKDIAPDSADLVHRPTFQPGAKNGLSCSRTIESLPRFALPVQWGGSNKKTVVWTIDEVDLGALLAAQDDANPGTNSHVSVGPSGTMTFDDFVKAIEATRPSWTKVIKT